MFTHFVSSLYCVQVEVLSNQYEWINTDKQLFGQPNTAYDFSTTSSRDSADKLTRLQEQKVSSITTSSYSITTSSYSITTLSQVHWNFQLHSRSIKVLKQVGVKHDIKLQ